MEKPDALLVDFTAGNRSIWDIKESKYILYLDTEPDLTIQPDILCDTRETQLKENSRHFAVFDPPHDYGRNKNVSIYNTPSLEVANKKWPKHYRETPPRYYGADKYKSKTELLRYIKEAQKEIARVLVPGGVLFFKWNECKVKLSDVLEYFNMWDAYLTIPQRVQGEHSHQTWWVLMIQNEGPWPQTELIDFFNGTIKKQSKRTDD